MNEWISAMFNALHLQDKQPMVFPLASSVNTAFKKKYPDTKKIVSTLNKKK